MKTAKQNVRVLVYDSDEVSAEPIMEIEGLRIVFDIRHIPGFSRGQVTITNMNDRQINRLVQGERWITVFTKLGSARERTIASRFYVNNATDVIKLPNRMVTLYCFDNLRRKVLEGQVDEICPVPSLENIIKQVVSKTHNGPIHFQDFPTGLIEDSGLRRTRSMQGSVQQVLKQLELEFQFRTYTVDGALVFMHSPDLNNLSETALATRPAEVILKTHAMQSNPVIGIATAKVTSNLDPLIKPAMVLDFSQLITVEAGASEETLQLVKDYTQNFSIYSKYQAFAVIHKGDTHSKLWTSVINCVSPTKGSLMPTVAWAAVT